MAKAHVEIMYQGKAQLKEGVYHADGALNPLDITLVPENCNIIAMAPASLITNVYGAGSFYELTWSDPGHSSSHRTVRLPAEMSYRV